MKNKILKMKIVMKLIRENEIGKLRLPKYVSKALDIVENVFRDIIKSLKPETKDEIIWELLNDFSDIEFESQEELLFESMVCLLELERIFKKKRRPLHYGFLVLFKYCKKITKNSEQKWAEAVVSLLEKRGYTLEEIQKGVEKVFV